MRLDFRRFLAESGDLIVRGPLRDKEVGLWKARLVSTLRDAVLRAKTGETPDQFLRFLEGVLADAPPRPQAVSVTHALRMYVQGLKDEGRSREGRVMLLTKAIDLVNKNLRGDPQARLTRR